MTDAYPDGGALATTPGAAPVRGTREPSAARRDGSMSLSFLLLGDTLNALRRAEGPGAIEGMPALDLAKRYASHGGAQRVLGFAAVNAITRHLFDRAGFEPRAAGGSLGDLDLGLGDRLGMIGLFPPLVPQVLATGAALTVLELRADLAGARDGWHVTVDADELAGCNKILATSTVLLDDTLDEVLGRWRHAQRVALVGPGAACLPDPLFARGVTLLGGSWIIDGAAFRLALASGKPWGAFARKFVLGADGYPGLDRLLERAAGGA